jgi:hypothetical protein
MSGVHPRRSRGRFPKEGKSAPTTAPQIQETNSRLNSQQETEASNRHPNNSWTCASSPL